jgi:hypothetical protein
LSNGKVRGINSALVIASARLQHITPTATAEGVITGTSNNLVSTRIAVENVLTYAPIERIVARITVQVVVPGATGNAIVAVAAVDAVATSTTIDNVVAVTGINDIVAAVPVDRVCTCIPTNHVVPSGPPQNIIAGAAAYRAWERCFAWGRRTQTCLRLRSSRNESDAERSDNEQSSYTFQHLTFAFTVKGRELNNLYISNIPQNGMVVHKCFMNTV